MLRNTCFICHVIQFQKDFLRNDFIKKITFQISAKSNL